MTFASKKSSSSYKNGILLKTQGFVVEAENWNYVFNGKFLKGLLYANIHVYELFADHFRT